MEKDRHCSYCGTEFVPGAPFPRMCQGCASVTYRNPIPVAVLLLPVDDGLLGIRRGIEPRRGELALPGRLRRCGPSRGSKPPVRELF